MRTSTMIRGLFFAFALLQGVCLAAPPASATEEEPLASRSPDAAFGAALSDQELKQQAGGYASASADLGNSKTGQRTAVILWDDYKPKHVHGKLAGDTVTAGGSSIHGVSNY